MLEQEEKYEYELISISFEQSYEQPEENVVWRVSEDAPSQNNAHTEIEYDADGIPMGQSMEEIRKRLENVRLLLMISLENGVLQIQKGKCSIM